jgi:hypothetical protein
MKKPELLHKYYPLNGERLGFVRSSLMRKRLWLSLPASFNDPFDCAPIIDVTWDPRAQKETATRIANERSQGLPRPQRRQELRNVKSNVGHLKALKRHEVQAIASEMMDDIRNNLGVLSLSTDPVNVLMWSHYAHSHTGVQLTFRTDQDDLISEAQPVQYTVNRPVVDVTGERAAAMRKTLLHKANYWQYEQEWRVVRTGQSGYNSFDPTSLEAITFGAKTSDEDKRAIRRAAEIGNLTPRYQQVAFNERLFELNIVPA